MAAAIPLPYAHDPFLVVQHALASRWLDPLMVGATWACEGWVLALLAVGGASIARRGRLLSAIPLAFLAVLAADAIAVQVLKHVLDLPRPLSVLGADRVRVLVAPLHAHSMPSGHSSVAAAAAAFQVRMRRAAGAALVVLAVLGGISRVYVGAHWGLDVVAGWILGAAIGVAGAALARAVADRRCRAPAAPLGAADAPSGP